ncbi:tRNA (adenosine(37)-N6)-threonylcarbamoyltransferase complex ATPase subunit type 1 TsaE [Streptomyces glaucosporus]|uniref:tRNA threonylcarbamoyladenosine biosynthesis protein TsaE n=1 Tax=Streptomyces glaucosporus TaxID=284044 RepID=A0ABN3IVT3_9ACTN
METPHHPAAGTDTGAFPESSSTVRIAVGTPDRMREVGRGLARLLRPGDLVLLTGELGAGKTTLTRGLGEGLGVRGAVTSPTFVIARVHPPLGDGPPLVHVDAYRLGGGLEEMEDLDLDVSLPESVVVVEWGEGKVEELSEDRLHVVIERAVGADAAGVPADGVGDHDVRTVTVAGVGARWAGVDLSFLGRPA